METIGCGNNSDANTRHERTSAGQVCGRWRARIKVAKLDKERNKVAINETVLEMHFHRPLMDVFRKVYGLGKGGINFYKYSPQKECFVGFDQAYVKSELTEDEFFDMLKENAANNKYKLTEKFIGYFLQYKVVKEMQVMKKYTPTGITKKPHYRVTLDTKKNINTNLSQHELLFNLSQNAGAMVYYACPMLFDRASLYEIKIDLSTLRLADLKTCPSAYSDNETHFIYFNEKDSAPVWCSKPVEGKAISPTELAKLLADRLKASDHSESALSLLNMLTDIKRLGLNESTDFFKERSIQPLFEVTKAPDILELVYDSLTIIKVTEGQEE